MLTQTARKWVSFFILVLPCWSSTAVIADPSAYQFEEVLEYTDEEACGKGENCLLAPYLAVAVFSDKKIEGRQVGVVLQDYFYCNEKTNEVYQVPAGFENDFMSIPELVQFAIRPKDFMEAGVIHDWLYAVGEPGKRKYADQVFHTVLEEQGAGLLKREAMYRAVRWRGKKAYGASEEIVIVDLETMAVIEPSPIRRPATTVVARINCGDKDEFERLREKLDSGYSFKSKKNTLFQHVGFEQDTVAQ